MPSLFGFFTKVRIGWNSFFVRSFDFFLLVAKMCNRPSLLQPFLKKSTMRLVRTPSCVKKTLQIYLIASFQASFLTSRRPCIFFQVPFLSLRQSNYSIPALSQSNSQLSVQADINIVLDPPSGLWGAEVTYSKCIKVNSAIGFYLVKLLSVNRDPKLFLRARNIQRGLQQYHLLCIEQTIARQPANLEIELKIISYS